VLGTSHYSDAARVLHPGIPVKYDPRHPAFLQPYHPDAVAEELIRMQQRCAKMREEGMRLTRDLDELRQRLETKLNPQQLGDICHQSNAQYDHKAS